MDHVLTAAFLSFFICYVFARGYEGKGLAEGACYGVIVGLTPDLGSRGRSTATS